MKTTSKAIYAISAVILTSSAFIHYCNSFPTYKSRSEAIAELKNEPLQEIQGAIEYYNKLKADPITGVINLQDIYAAQAEVKKSSTFKTSSSNIGLSWTELGPDNIGGRTRAILIDKNNPNKLFAGGVSGGLFVSTNSGGNWTPVNGYDQLGNIAVTCITQAANGDIYVGTGESLYQPVAGWGVGGGIAGGGVFKSTDGGNSFSLLPSTKPAANVSSGAWVLISNIAASPTDPNKIYVATDNGFKMTYDGGNTWLSILKNGNGSSNNTRATDVDVSDDGTVVVAVGNKSYISYTGDTSSFTQILGGLPAVSSISRIEFAIAKSDQNFMYASISNSSNLLYGIYQSVNKGKTWKVIGPGGSKQFEPFSSGGQGQGSYDNAISVSPFDCRFVILGGIELYRWKATSPTDTNGIGQWTNIDSPGSFPGNPYYIHSDKHKIVFHPTAPNTVYIGCDGGVFRSSNILGVLPTFTAMNRGYNVTQFYSVAFSRAAASGPGDPIVVGGTQDNGTLMIDGQGATVQSALAVGGGDGGEAAVSNLSGNEFSTVYYGQLARNGGNIYDNKVLALKYGALALGSSGFASFVTPIALYESMSGTVSYDSVNYVSNTFHFAGDTVGVLSKRAGLYFQYVLPISLNDGDVLRVPDVVQTRLAVGFAGPNGVYMTANPLENVTNPKWFHVLQLPGGTVEALKWSPDGNILYVGTDGGAVYRISNMLAAIDSTNGDVASSQKKTITTQIAGFGRLITDIAIDPNDDNRILVSLSNYGTVNYVYLCNNAKTVAASVGAANFTSVQGNGAQKLPAMPVYSAVFVKSQPNTVLLATEFGVWATSDITQPAASIVWEQETNGQLPQVPCYMMSQQTLDPWDCVNSGAIYVATHGRGFWRCNTYFSPFTGIADKTSVKSADVNMYPNPVVNNTTVAFTINKRTDINFNIYDLNGKLVKSTEMKNVAEGSQHVNLNCSELTSGTYLLNLKGNDVNATKRFVVIK